MAKNNDPNTLQFNIDADTSKLKSSFQEAAKLFKQFNEVSKISLKNINQNNLKQFFENAKDPLQSASKLLAAFNKELAKSQDAIYKNIAKGKPTVDAINDYNKIVDAINTTKKALEGSESYQKALNSEIQSQLDKEKELEEIARRKKREERKEQRQEKAKQALSAFYISLDPEAQKTSELLNLQKQLEAQYIKIASLSRISPEKAKQLEKIKNELAKLKKELDGNGKKAKQADGWFKKLLGRIRNVSIYRSIRTVLKAITQGFEEGINNFAQFDESANATMSNINGSLQQIRNTMGIAMVSALQALEPIIISVSNALINLLDAFNLAMAKMAGKTTYNKAIKNVDDYAASVDKAKGSLADFDKFRTLDVEQTDPTEMFSEEKIDENESRLSDFFGSILKFIKEIWNTISTVWQDLTDLGIWDILIDVFGDVADIIAVVVKLIGGIIKGLHDMGMLKGVLYGLIIVWGLYKAAAMSAAAANALAWVTAHPILGTTILVGALATLTGIISSFQNISSSNITSGGGFTTVGLADGGFTTANFIATNENGVREWVGSNGSATAVVNDTQMSDIMYQAVKDGCYEGVVDALSDANSYSATNNDNSVATVEIQGETLFTIVRNVAQKQGLKFSRV